MLDCPGHIDPPMLARDVRHDAKIEHRPVLHNVLAGRQALRVRSRMAAGQELAVAGPFLLGAGEFGIGWKRCVVAAAHLRGRIGPAAATSLDQIGASGQRSLGRSRHFETSTSRRCMMLKWLKRRRGARKGYVSFGTALSEIEAALSRAKADSAQSNQGSRRE